MNKLTGLVEKYLLPVAEKLSTNKYLRAVSSGFQTLLPITMIGAIFTLLSSLQIDIYQDFITASHLKEIFNFAPTVTTNMLAVYTVAFIGYAMTKLLGNEKDSLICGGLSLFAFLLLIPQGTTGVAADGIEKVFVAGAIEMRFLGAAGLFSAIIVGILVPLIYVKVIKLGWTIKLPDGVPPAIANSFNALIPAFIVCIVFSLVRFGFSLTEFKHFNMFIYSFLQKPLLSLGNHPLAYMALVFCCSFFWFFGIHGGQIVNPILSAVYLPLAVENLTALQNGVAAADLPNILSQSWWFTYSSLGGGGGTLGLCLVMFFLSKSSRYKSLGRLSLPASICGINEPLTFGLPIVLNPVIIVPFILTPLCTFLIAYACTMIGLVPPLNGVQVATGTPVLLSAWMTGGISVMILQACLVVVQIVIYYPFFKVIDKRAVDEEKVVETSMEMTSV